MNTSDDDAVAEGQVDFLDENGSFDELTDDEQAAAEEVTFDDIADNLEGDDDTDGQATGSDAQPRQSPYQRRRAATRRGGRAGIVIGVLIAATFCFGGTGIAITGSETMPALADNGVTPGVLFLLAAIALATVTFLRSLANVRHELEISHHEGLDAQLRRQLERLVANGGAGRPDTDGNSDSSSEDAQQMRLALQRQDEKINNLTRAIKMYGKPLVDIANHGTEVGAVLTQLQATTETGTDSIREVMSRLETQVLASTGNAPSLQPLQDQFVKLQIAVQAISQRLEDSEMRKAIMRLEDTATQTREQILQLARGESIDNATDKLRAQLDAATTKLHDGLRQMRDGKLGDLENTVRDIQREVATVATATAQIQAAIKSGARPIAAAPSKAPSGQPAPAAQPTAAPAAATPAASGDGGDGYQTGARKTGSKNVLGAIAKLKSMKG